jgi:hypothetical protein
VGKEKREPSQHLLWGGLHGKHVVTSGKGKREPSQHLLWGGLHGKDVVGTGKEKTGTIPAFVVGRATLEVCSGKEKTGTIPAFAEGRATWEACSGNWERKNGNHPSICCREGYMGSM